MRAPPNKLTVRDDGNGRWSCDEALLEKEELADDSTGLSSLAGGQTPDIQRADPSITYRAIPAIPISSAQRINGDQSSEE